MRVSESRYTRDLRRINLAQRMIQHEVRTYWICQWAGISDERVRNLVKSYDQSRAGVARHRGPPPKVFTPLLRTSAMRAEASALAGLASALYLVPSSPVPNARKALPAVELGERLVYVYELYKFIVPAPKLTMDLFILLVVNLAEGKELEVGRCKQCQAAVLLDRLASRPRLCEVCRPPRGRRAAKAPANKYSDSPASEDRRRRPVESQQDLFRAAAGSTQGAPGDSQDLRGVGDPPGKRSRRALGTDSRALLIGQEAKKQVIPGESRNAGQGERQNGAEGKPDWVDQFPKERGQSAENREYSQGDSHDGLDQREQRDKRPADRLPQDP